MMTKIRETTNYGIFDINEINRDIRTDRVKKSMEKRGWVDAYPMHCTKGKRGKIKIKGGHHRFSAAVQLGLPVKYVMSDDDMTLYDIESTTTPWNIRDFLVSRANSGDPDCIEVREYSEETGIPVGLALSMFWGNAAGSGNAQAFLKKGEFRIKDRAHPAVVARIVHTMKEVGVKFAHSSLMVQAISKVALVPEFDLDRMLKQIRNHYEVIEKQPNLQGYLDMMETLYNRSRKSNKIPIAFRAAEVAAERNRAGLKR